MPYLEEQVVASVVDTNAADLQMFMMDVQRQTNGNDCGLFSIANAVTLCLGLNPYEFNYRIPLMRSHLIKCLESREMKMFPVQGSRKRKKKSGIKNTITTDLFCLPNARYPYNVCELWRMRPKIPSCMHWFNGRRGKNYGQRLLSWMQRRQTDRINVHILDKVKLEI